MKDVGPKTPVRVGLFLFGLSGVVATVWLGAANLDLRGAAVLSSLLVAVGFLLTLTAPLWLGRSACQRWVTVVSEAAPVFLLLAFVAVVYSSFYPSSSIDEIIRLAFGLSGFCWGFYTAAALVPGWMFGGPSPMRREVSAESD